LQGRICVHIQCKSRKEEMSRKFERHNPSLKNT
jgi:hypothetical protein